MELRVDKEKGDVVRRGAAVVADGDDEGVVPDEPCADLLGLGDEGLRLMDGNRRVLGGADRKHPEYEKKAAYEVEACACVHPSSHQRPRIRCVLIKYLPEPGREFVINYGLDTDSRWMDA